MKCFKTILSVIGLLSLSFTTTNVLAENGFYVVSIRRDDNDAFYDEAPDSIKIATNELVNDRMNDIYNIIIDNKKSYRLNNGQIDDMLNELESNALIKRNENHKKFRFINKNRIDDIKFSKRDDDYIPLESNLVSHVVPVLNYYTVRAYLTDDIIDKVLHLKNVFRVSKSVTIGKPEYEDYDIKVSENLMFNSSTSLITRSNTEEKVYYNLGDIKKETGWSGVSIQKNAPFHLSTISQGRYHNTYEGESDGTFKDYDNNYYYPSTAGKGVEIFLVDDGIITNHEDFDKYKGTPDERIFTCDGFVTNGTFIKAEGDQERKCMAKAFLENNNKNIYLTPVHGMLVASLTGGTKYGVAKKANIHMIATDYEETDYLTVFDHIKQVAANPSKTVINISRGNNAENLCSPDVANLLQDKIDEMVALGFMIFVASGNSDLYLEKEQYPFDKNLITFTQLRNVIVVGHTQTLGVGDISKLKLNNMESFYSFATKMSNYGPAVDIIGPGNGISASYDACIFRDIGICEETFLGSHSSNATPIVAGVAALIIAEHPEIQFNHELMKQTLIDMSLKDILTVPPGKERAINKFVNNGKKLIYNPRDPAIYPIDTSTTTTTSTPVTTTTTSTTPVITTPVTTTTTTTTTSTTPVITTSITTTNTITNDNTSPAISNIITAYETSISYTTVTSTFTSIETATIYQKIC